MEVVVVEVNVIVVVVEAALVVVEIDDSCGIGRS